MYKAGDVVKNLETGEVLLILMANEVGIRYINADKPQFDDLSNLKTDHVWLEKISDKLLHVGNVDDLVKYASRAVEFVRG